MMRFDRFTERAQEAAQRAAEIIQRADGIRGDPRLLNDKVLAVGVGRDVNGVTRLRRVDGRLDRGVVGWDMKKR